MAIYPTSRRAGAATPRSAAVPAVAQLLMRVVLQLHSVICTINAHVHCVSKNDTDLAHYNFDVDQPVVINFWQVIATEFKLS